MLLNKLQNIPNFDLQDNQTSSPIASILKILRTRLTQETPSKRQPDQALYASMHTMPRRLMPLIGEQAEECCFPVHCPVYITAPAPNAPDTMPPQIVARANVTEVLLQIGRSNSITQNLELFYRVSLDQSPYMKWSSPSHSDLCRQSSLRYCNGCPVSVNVNGQEEGNNKDEEDWREGVILGMSDVPSSKKADGVDSYSYTVELLGKDGDNDEITTSTTLHNVLQGNIQFRPSALKAVTKDDDQGQQGNVHVEDRIAEDDQETLNSNAAAAGVKEEHREEKEEIRTQETRSDSQPEPEQESEHQEKEQEQEKVKGSGDSVTTDSNIPESSTGRVKVEFHLNPDQRAVTQDTEQPEAGPQAQPDADPQSPPQQEEPEAPVEKQSRKIPKGQKKQKEIKETKKSSALELFMKKRKAKEQKHVMKQEDEERPSKAQKCDTGAADNNPKGHNDVDSSDDEMDIKLSHERILQKKPGLKRTRKVQRKPSLSIGAIPERKRPLSPPPNNADVHDDEKRVTAATPTTTSNQEPQDMSIDDSVEIISVHGGKTADEQIENNDKTAVPSTDQTAHSQNDKPETDKPVPDAPLPSKPEGLQIKIPKKRKSTLDTSTSDTATSAPPAPPSTFAQTSAPAPAPVSVNENPTIPTDVTTNVDVPAPSIALHEKPIQKARKKLKNTVRTKSNLCTQMEHEAEKPQDKFTTPPKSSIIGSHPICAGKNNWSSPQHYNFHSITRFPVVSACMTGKNLLQLFIILS